MLGPRACLEDVVDEITPPDLVIFCSAGLDEDLHASHAALERGWLLLDVAISFLLHMRLLS